jgi:hypothetical protein
MPDRFAMARIARAFAVVAKFWIWSTGASKAPFTVVWPVAVLVVIMSMSCGSSAAAGRALARRPPAAAAAPTPAIRRKALRSRTSSVGLASLTVRPAAPCWASWATRASSSSMRACSAFREDPIPASSRHPGRSPNRG